MERAAQYERTTRVPELVTRDIADFDALQRENGFRDPPRSFERS
jgi:hypothetical protein